MVVEDDAPLRVALAASLGSHGYSVIETGSAEEAIVLAEQRPPDLVLLDLTLTGTDGLQAVRRLRSFTAVPIVVLTVRSGKSDKLAALDGPSTRTRRSGRDRARRRRRDRSCPTARHEGR